MDIRLNELNKTIINCKKCPRLVKFVQEHITDLITELAWYAKENAEENNHKTLKPAHWYFLQLPPDAGRGYWAENATYMDGLK